METDSVYLQDWQEISDETTKGQILEKVVEQGLLGIKHAQQSQLFYKRLTFYPGCCLYWFKANYPHGIENRYLVGNKAKNDYKLLDSSKTVFELNSNCPVQLSVASVADYLRFYSEFFMEKEESFFIIENLQHPRFLQNEAFKILPEEKKRKIAEILIPLRIEEKDGYFKALASVYDGTDYFRCEFIIQHDGSVQKFPQTFSTEPPPDTEKIPELTKDNVLDYVREYLPEKEGLTLPPPSHDKEKGNYVIVEKKDFLWITPLLKEEEVKIDGYLKSSNKKIKKSEDGKHLELEVLALKGRQLRRLSISVCKEDSPSWHDATQPDNEKKGNISLKQPELPIELVNGLPDNWCYGVELALVDRYQWISENPSQDIKKAIVQELNRSFVPLIDESKVISIRKTGLPFYPETTLYEISFSKPVETKLNQFFCSYLFYRNGEFQDAPLDWSSPPIHNMNRVCSIKLDSGNAADYLRFFCDFVCGDYGPFTIIESRDHPRFRGVDLTKMEYGDLKLSFEEKQALWNNIKPLEIIISEEQKDGRTVHFFKTEGCVWYSDRLFSAPFKIFTNGMVEMGDDRELLTLPSSGNTPWHQGNIVPLQLSPVPKQPKTVIDQEKNKILEGGVTDTYIVGVVNFEGEIVQKKLTIKNCRFRGPVDFSSLHCKGLLEIENCVFENTLTLSNAQLDGGLMLKNVTVLFGLQNPRWSFSMKGVSARHVELTNVCCQRKCDFSDLIVKSELTAIKLYATGEVDFERSRISGSMRLLSEEKSKEKISPEGDWQFTVGGPLKLKDLECRHLTLEGLSIAAQLDLSDANLGGGLEMTRSDAFGFYVAGYVALINLQARYITVSGINVAGEFSVQNATIGESVNISSYKHFPTKIGYWNDFDPEAITVKLGLNLYGITIKHGNLMFSGIDIADDLTLTFAKIGTGVFLRSTFVCPLVNNIGGSLILDGLDASSGLFLEGVRIKKQLKGRMVSARILRIFPGLVKLPKVGDSDITDKIEHRVCLTEIEEGIDLPQFRMRKGEFSGLKVTGLTRNNVSLNLKQSEVEGSLEFFTSWEEIKDRLRENFLNPIKNDPRKWQEEKDKIDQLFENSVNDHENFCRTQAKYGINLKNCKITYDLDLSCIQCCEGSFDLENAEIGGDVHVVVKKNQATDYEKAHALEFRADSANIGDDMDLTGLILERPPKKINSPFDGSVIAPKITVTGALSFYKNAQQHTGIPGKLDLESARKIGKLAISDDWFSSVRPEDAIILKQAYIERLVVWYDADSKSYPRPVELDFMSVDCWEFEGKDRSKKDHSNVAENYINFLENSGLLQRHTYRAVEDTLLNQGLEEDADKIHAALHTRALEDDFKKIGGPIQDLYLLSKRLWIFLCWPFRWIWGASTNYGTQPKWPIAVFVMWLMVSTFCVFSISDNILTSTAATQDGQPKKHPCSGDWNSMDGFMLALRYHIPIITLDARDEWAPSHDDKQMQVKLPLLDTFTLNITPEDYAVFVSITHWILLPFIVFAVSRRILRKRGSS